MLPMLSISGGKKAVGQIEYTTPGTYTFTVPDNVYSVSVVCVGAAARTSAASAKNSIFGSTVIAYGNNGRIGGSFSGGDGGGKGGDGGYISYNYFQQVRCSGGGGGAGGYSGNGGNGGNGSAWPVSGWRRASGGRGGNVGIYGEGASGSAAPGAYPANNGVGGAGGGGDGGEVNSSGAEIHGANGGEGSNGTSAGFGAGPGGYSSQNQDGWGGGGLVYKNNIPVTPGQEISIQVGAGVSGSEGAVRVIWPGDERQFPSTRTVDEVEE